MSPSQRDSRKIRFRAVTAVVAVADPRFLRQEARALQEEMADLTIAPAAAEAAWAAPAERGRRLNQEPEGQVLSMTSQALIASMVLEAEAADRKMVTSLPVLQALTMRVLAVMMRVSEETPSMALAVAVAVAVATVGLTLMPAVTAVTA